MPQSFARNLLALRVEITPKSLSLLVCVPLTAWTAPSRPIFLLHRPHFHHFYRRLLPLVLVAPVAFGVQEIIYFRILFKKTPTNEMLEQRTTALCYGVDFRIVQESCTKLHDAVHFLYCLAVCSLVVPHVRKKTEFRRVSCACVAWWTLRICLSTKTTW